MTDMRRTAISMPVPMLTDLKQEAERRDMSLSQLIREYIRFGRHRDTPALDLQREGTTNDNG